MLRPSTARASILEPSPRTVDLDEEATNPFARLVLTYRSNESLLGRLAETRADLRRARAYAARPGSNPALAAARIDQLRARHSRLLCHLRANRLVIHALLGIPPKQD